MTHSNSSPLNRSNCCTLGMHTWHFAASDAFRANHAGRHKGNHKRLSLLPWYLIAKVYSARARRINSVRHAMYTYLQRAAEMSLSARRSRISASKSLEKRRYLDFSSASARWKILSNRYVFSRSGSAAYAETCPTGAYEETKD